MILKKYWYSLRSRFMLSAIILLILVSSGAYWTYQDIQQVRQAIIANLQTHRNLNDTARQVRLHILDCTLHIDAYLLEPAITRYSEQAFESIDKAILLTRQMRKYPAEILGREIQKIDQLEKDLLQLVEKASYLFEVRADADRQFPSMAVGNDIMQPNRDALNNAMALSLNELQTENAMTNSPSIYNKFVDSRYLWSQMLSNFRLYLANRVGSFNEKALPVQELAIDTMYAELKKHTDELVQLSEQGKLGFQSSLTVEDINRALQNWYTGFNKVKEIHHADGWRVDSKIMSDEIVPLLDTMSSLLTDIENRINQATSENVDVLARATKRQATILFWGTAGILLLMILVFWTTNRLVFRPLAMVVKALKAEATGVDSVLLPEVRSQETAALVDSFSEMAKQVRKRQSDLEHQALHDSLTGLPNRTLLHERIYHDIQVARRNNTDISLLLLDIDRFKEVNDTLGHHVGDHLLVAIGKRFTEVIRNADTIARLGGDEFAVVLTDTGTIAAGKVAGKMLAAMEKTIQVESYQLYVSISIGIATYPQHGDDATTLIQHADVAMYNAKQNQAGYCIYDPSEDSYSLKRLELINDLRDAIDKNSLDLYFHPIIDLQDDVVVGVEGLLRWQHPRFGLLSPQQVIELAEHTGLINPLTYWVLTHALEKLHGLHMAGYKLSISINISTHNLKDPQFIDKVSDILHDNTIPHQMIVFEITESAMMSNLLRATELLTQLDEMGIKLSVDDFGTGFSSLAYLKQLPVDELKIDRSFIAGMRDNSSDETIVRSTIELAHNLGLEVVAEGVEDKETLQLLKVWGCDRVQGYLYTRPVPLDGLQNWLGEYKLNRLAEPG